MPSALMETTQPIIEIIEEQTVKKKGKRKKPALDEEHTHFLVIPKVEGGNLTEEIITSTDDEHAHIVNFNPDTEQFEIFGSPDGHTHAIVEFKPRARKLNKQSDDEIMGEIENKHNESLEEHSDYIEKANRAEGLISGTEEHWKASTEAKLEAEKRAHHKVNFLLTNFLQSSGLQRSRRNDIVPRPREGSDMFIADIFKQLIKGILTNNMFSYEETDATDDQRIGGRGNLRCLWATDQLLSGEILIDYMLWDEVHYGPHNRKDLKDCRYVIFHDWVTQEDLLADYPHKEDEIDQDFKVVDEFMSKFEQEQQDRSKTTISTTVRPKITFPNGRVSDWFDIDRKRALKLTLWKKVVIPVHVAVKVETNFYFGMEGLSKDEQRSIDSIPGLSLVPEKKFELWRAVAAGNTMLEEEFEPDYEDILPSFAYYAFKRRNVIFGIVWPAEDMQIALNKLYSQVSDIINAAAGYIEYYDGNMFFSKKEEADWKRYGNTPGYKVKLKNVERRPVQRDGIKVPAELFSLIVMFDQTLSRIMSINPEFRGEEGRAESGIAIQTKNAGSVRGQEYLFDNAKIPEINLGKLIIKLIQKNYSVDRIMRELESQSATEDFTIAGTKYSKLQKGEIRRRLKDFDLVKLDVTVDLSPQSPTIMSETFFILNEMKKAGINIPDDMVIPFVPGLSYTQKTEAITRIKQQLEQAQNIETGKVLMEGKKTDTAAQSRVQTALINKS